MNSHGCLEFCERLYMHLRLDGATFGGAKEKLFTDVVGLVIGTEACLRATH